MLARHHKKDNHGETSNEACRCSIPAHRVPGSTGRRPGRSRHRAGPGKPGRSAGAAHRRSRGHLDAARPGHGDTKCPSQCSDTEQPHDRTAAPAEPDRLPGAECRQRDRQCGAGQSLPARRKFPRLHRLAAAGRAAGPVGIPGWRADQRAIRRHRQLGPAAAVGHRQHAAHSRLEPGVRLQHPGRRAGGLYQERQRLSGRRGQLPRLLRPPRGRIRTGRQERPWIIS